ncbi:MAG: hypothetical protein ACM30G_17675 [Micromonosporaceae bacterium]
MSSLPLVRSRRGRLFSLTAVATVVVALTVTGTLAWDARDRGEGGTRPTGGSTTPVVTTSPTPPAGLAPPTVNVAVNGYYSWALLDRRTGARYGSANMTVINFTESMVKAWLASDYLRRTAEAGTEPPQSRLDQLVRMIRDSNDGAAESIWNLGGRDADIRRLISVCKLQDTKVFPEWWSQTMISARDAVTMGECVANGTAAGPKWTPWVLNEMRNVRGEGRFGIVNALPGPQAATVAIKNGWTLHSGGTWHVNCLGIHDDWIIAVMTYYSGSLGLSYGAGICEQVARQALHLS